MFIHLIVSIAMSCLRVASSTRVRMVASVAVLSLLRMAFTAAPDEQVATPASEMRGDMPEIPVSTNEVAHSPPASDSHETSADSHVDKEGQELPLAEAAVRLSTLMLCGGEEGDILRYSSAVKAAAARKCGAASFPCLRFLRCFRGGHSKDEVP